MEPTLTITPSGNKYWLLNDKLHRIDGPAIEYANGDKMWCLNDKYHRVDGPAVEYANGDKWWWLYDKYYFSFNEWKQEVRKYYDTQEDYLLMLLKL